MHKYVKIFDRKGQLKKRVAPPVYRFNKQCDFNAAMIASRSMRKIRKDESNMKKLIALLLTLFLITVSLAAVAETLNLEGVTDESAVIDVEMGIPEKTILAATKGTRTSDKVYDTTGAVTIETPFGVVLTFNTSSGFEYLTQDYFHDIDKYTKYYSDPLAVVQKFIDEEMHLNVFTASGSCLDTFFYVMSSQNSLAQAIGNTNSLSSSDADYVASYLTNLNNVEFIYGTVGSQVWFIADLIESNNMIVGFTYVNGHMIQAYMYNVVSESDVTTVMAELASVSFSEK